MRSRMVALGTTTLLVLFTLGGMLTHATTPSLSATLTVALTLRTHGEPFDIAVDAATDHAFVPDSTENVLYVFDLATAKPIAFVPTGGQPNHVVVVGSRAYVSNFADATITVIDTASLEAVETLEMGGLGLAADATSGLLYAAAGSRLFILDTADHKSVKTVDAPAGANIWALALDPARGRLYVTDIANPQVLIFDTRSAAFVGAVPLDAPARFGIAFDPAGRVLVASYTGQDPQLSMIDAATGAVLTRTAVGPFTTALAVGPDATVYATSRGDRAVTALSTGTLAARSRTSFTEMPGAVAVVASTGVVIAATSGGAPPPVRSIELAPEALP